MTDLLGWRSRLPRGGPQLAALALALAANAVVSPDFFHLLLRDGRLFGSPVDILNRGAPTVLLGVGMALVIATRGIDLSVGSVMAIAGAVAAAGVAHGLPWGVSIALALGAGVACGLWNGLLVAIMGIQPIVATLVLMVAGRGVAQLITSGRILTFDEPHLLWIGGGAIAGLPVAVVVALAAAALVLLMVRRTALALFIEAVGVNPQASRLAGVPSRAVLVYVYLVSGLLAATAGVLAAADIRAADANNAGLWLELDAILAVVLGGGSLYGGRFSLGLTVVGALTLQTLKTCILRAGFPPEFNLIAMAGVVAVVLVIQSPAVGALGGRLVPRLREVRL
ncbi:MAG: ABC transporter permease [Phenylobacterium sp.]|nr:MAG: ABC transporter permease [Phenylobacterium sp.]